MSTIPESFAPPVRVYTGEAAFENLRENAASRWPRRGAPNDRFAGIAMPAFTPKFAIRPGEKVFTIGSCFARNVERALAAEGFDVLSLKQPIPHIGDLEQPTTAMNNYNPLSIGNELDWAFGHRTFDVERHAYRMSESGYMDLHLTNVLPPVTAEQLLERRAAIGAIYRRLAEASVVVLTLGLIEAWRDRRADTYINLTPPKIALRSEPERFELHVLSFVRVRQAVEEVIGRLGTICRPGVRVLLTVSPVPLTATFTEQDVAVANTHSKSLLRAVAGEVVATHDNVDYFPSYEAVTLTGRDAYDTDQVHVLGGVVQRIMQQVREKYVASDESGDEPADAAAAGGTTPQPGATLAAARREYAAGRHAAAMAVAREALEAAPPNAWELQVLLARCHLRLGQLAAAEQVIGAVQKHEATPSVRSLCLRAELAAAKGDPALQRRLLEKALAIEKQSPLANRMLAELLAGEGDHAGAKTLLQRALKRGQDDVLSWKRLRDVHLALGEAKEAASAQEVVVLLRPGSAAEKARLEELAAAAARGA